MATQKQAQLIIMHIYDFQTKFVQSKGWVSFEFNLT